MEQGVTKGRGRPRKVTAQNEGGTTDRRETEDSTQKQREADEGHETVTTMVNYVATTTWWNSTSGRNAAHMLHKDGKGHGRIIRTMGGAPIFSKSYKFKQMTRSSTESEMVCLDEAVTYAIRISFAVLLPFRHKID